jgi:large subunit ribosomal protein L10
MAVTKAKKFEQVEELSKELKSVSSVIVATYSKLTVAQDYELRKSLRSSGAKYRVVKNTLAERAAKGTKVEEALKDLSGVTSIAYTEGDPVALAKAVAKYAKDNPEFTLSRGSWKAAWSRSMRSRRWLPCLRRANCTPSCCFLSMPRRSAWLRC